MAGIVRDWLSWLGLSGTACHGWNCQGLVVMAGIVRDWLSWLGLSGGSVVMDGIIRGWIVMDGIVRGLVVMAGTRGAGCHGWDCQGISCHIWECQGLVVLDEIFRVCLAWLGIVRVLVVMDWIVRGAG